VDATGVSVNAPIVLEFSQPMDRATTEAAFDVAGVTGTIAWSDSDTVLTFTPDSSLMYGSTYTVSLTGATDVAGNALADEFYSFTTAWAVTVNETDGSTAVVEGIGSDTCEMVLTVAPTADVLVNLSTDGETDVTPASLTFTSANWDVPQQFTVSGIADGVVEGPHTSTVSYTTSSGDAMFDGYDNTAVVVDVTDIENALQQFVERLGEGQMRAVVRVLCSDVTPVAVPVHFTVGGSATAGGDFALPASPVTIPAGEQWVDVSLTVHHDDETEGDETVTIDLQPDSGYVLSLPGAATIEIQDADIGVNGGGGCGSPNRSPWALLPLMCVVLWRARRWAPRSARSMR
jgi:hypothetical protein